MPLSDGRAFAEENDALFYEASAKNSTNVVDAITKLCGKAMEVQEELGLMSAPKRRKLNPATKRSVVELPTPK